MNKNSKIFITKDALYRGYLPVYGNEFWRGKTPNMDYLASKGTVFESFYTAAPSTTMSNISMFTGKYPYESELKDYSITNRKFPGMTLFDCAKEKGFECHIIWDIAWVNSFKMLERYDVYGENTVIHNLEIRQGVGAHYIHKDPLVSDDNKTKSVFELIENELSRIVENNRKCFVWLHIPHVINGRTGYGTDVDAFDHVVGIVMKHFDENNIIISADHGNMNGFKNKLGYGFDVYQPNILIPLIAPGIKANKDALLCNIDIYNLIFHGEINEREYVLSDSAFYAQPNRKLAILNKNYKYIYHKRTGYEELYDLRIDPIEQFNLIEDTIYDIDRHVTSPSKELYFYPYWNELGDVRRYFRTIRESVWRNGTIKEEFIPRTKYFIQSHGYNRLIKHLK